MRGTPCTSESLPYPSHATRIPSAPPPRHPSDSRAGRPPWLLVPAPGDGVSASRYAIRRRTSSTPGPADQHGAHSLAIRVISRCPSCLPVSPFIRVISVFRVISRYSSHLSLSFSSLLIQVISRYPNQLPLSESYPIIRVISLYPNYLSHLPSSESYPVIRERIISRCPSHLPLSQSFSLSESSRCPSPLSLSESAPHRHCGLPAGC